MDSTGDETAFAPYIRAWQKRWEEERQTAARAADETRAAAQRLARLLVERYDARRVVLVGSLARGEFRAGSDIDLAAEGIPDASLFRAGADLEAAAGELHVDLVPIESANPAFLADLARDGVVLYDARTGPVDVTCDPPSGTTMPLGTTWVWCDAADAAGNTVRGSFTVTVQDTVPPDVTAVEPSRRLLWPPNHQVVPLSLAVSAVDIGDPEPACRIVGIYSSEPLDGTGDGDMAPDWGYEGLEFWLRAERAGYGNGRVYTITVQCTDAAGNDATSGTTVSVPKDQRGR